MALAAAVLSTSFVSGVFGMAGGMILMGILAQGLFLVFGGSLDGGVFTFS
jgi:hypothetical protein